MKPSKKLKDKKEYIEVRREWFETLLRYADLYRNGDLPKEAILGYISSAKTILGIEEEP